MMIHRHCSKKPPIFFFAGFLMASSVSGQSIFKINQYNVYYNKGFMPIATLFANHQFTDKLSITSYFYVNAYQKNSWGEGLVGLTYTPVPGISIGCLGGLQSNDPVVWRISPIVILSKNQFSFFGAFESGGKRYRWDAMGLYSVKAFKFGAELIRYYQMYAAGPRIEFSFIKKQPITIFYSGLWDWVNSRYASMFGIYSSFGANKKNGIRP
ncbi:MAG: hypothetical protein NTV01_12295 [Bacteroidia bacterium]|nr:hypothetical protein [Bacteroidia bacterium]